MVKHLRQYVSSIWCILRANIRLLFWWLNGEGEGLSVSVCLSVCYPWFLLDIYDWDDQIKVILKQTQMLLVD